MIYPSIDEITKGQYNRYTLCIATAKCARIVTDEYVEQRAVAEKMLANKETDKSIASMIKREIRDEKAVKTAIKALNDGEYRVVEGEEAEGMEDVKPSAADIRASFLSKIGLAVDSMEDRDSDDEQAEAADEEALPEDEDAEDTEDTEDAEEEEEEIELYMGEDN